MENHPRTRGKMIPFITPPWVKPPKIPIEQDKIQAKILHERLLQTLSIKSAGYYTDENGINQKVGAAAVQLGQGFSNISVFSGSNTYYTVYAAELSGILVAIHMALAIPSTSQVRRILIFTDNQSALRSIPKPRKSSGQTIIQDILGVIQKVRIRGIDTEFHWVPAHLGITGNEKADIAAKKSSGWRTQARKNGRQIEIDTDKTSHQIRVPPLIAAIRTAHRQRSYEKWKTSWSKEAKGRALRLLVSQPDQTSLKIHTKLKKPQSSLLVHMRTGKIGLRSF